MAGSHNGLDSSYSLAISPHYKLRAGKRGDHIPPFICECELSASNSGKDHTAIREKQFKHIASHIVIASSLKTYANFKVCIGGIPIISIVSIPISGSIFIKPKASAVRIDRLNRPRSNNAVTLSPFYTVEFPPNWKGYIIMRIFLRLWHIFVVHLI